MRGKKLNQQFAFQKSESLLSLVIVILVTCWCTRWCPHAPLTGVAVDEPLTPPIRPAWRTRGVRTAAAVDAADATFDAVFAPLPI